MKDAVAIVLAAGSGDRLGADRPKALVALAGTSLLSRSVRSALAARSVARVVAVVPPGAEQAAAADLSTIDAVTVVAGGETRAASTRCGLAGLTAGETLVVVHDAARPLASPELFDRVIAAVRSDATADGAIPVLPVVDTVKRVSSGLVVATEPRDELALAQTPQAFRTERLRVAHDAAERAGVVVTDDARALELIGGRVVAVDGEATNRKITTADDLALAEAVLADA